MPPITPPIKCQGIKTRLIPLIRTCAPQQIAGQWIEPFCGSCVVALNVQPRRAVLADTNRHIIALYQAIQHGTITPERVRHFLTDEGARLSRHGEAYYYDVRERFNANGDSLDFLFLNRSCFNGVMRFNREGRFNVPSGRKPDRFRPAYITKIVNQVSAFQRVVSGNEWRFVVADFRETLAQATDSDFIYADPPYIGRHVDYFNTWRVDEEDTLIDLLKRSPAHFLLSTWHSNRYRHNPALAEQWHDSRFSLVTCEHFYHVGATENLRNAMTEALIASYPLPESLPQKPAKRDTMVISLPCRSRHC